jgi:hypothetical protein
MQANEINIRGIVPHGGMKLIAEKLGMTAQAVSLALKVAKPNHPAVRLALQMAEESGTLVAAQQLAKLTPIAQAA